MYQRWIGAGYGSPYVDLDCDWSEMAESWGTHWTPDAESFQRSGRVYLDGVLAYAYGSRTAPYAVLAVHVGYDGLEVRGRLEGSQPVVLTILYDAPDARVDALQHRVDRLEDLVGFVDRLGPGILDLLSDADAVSTLERVLREMKRRS